MLKIKSPARINRRYLLLKAKSKEEIEKTILDYIGILGWAKAAPQFVRSEKGIVLAVDRKSLAPIRAAFEISPTEIKVIAVSGTLKGLDRK